MSSYLKIEPFLSRNEIRHFLTFCDYNFIKHNSSTSNTYSNLQFLPVEFRNIERALLSKIEKNVTIDWHTDGTSFRRNTVIIHPITDNYAPCETIDGLTSDVMILNTQQSHRVVNNNHTRLNLQIPLDINYEELMSNENHQIWNFIARLYE